MQCGLPPGAHTSRSLMLGPKLSPGAMLTRSRAGKHGGFLPLAPGCRSPAFSLPPLAPQHAGDRQAVRDVSQIPSEKQKSLVTAIGAGLLGPSLPTAGSGTGCLESFASSAWGPAGEGSAWHGATSPICWKWGFGGRNCCSPHGPFCPSCNAKSWATQGCGAPVTPHPLPASCAASPTTSPQFPGKQKAFTSVRSQRQESSSGKEKEKEKIMLRGNDLHRAALLMPRCCGRQ